MPGFGREQSQVHQCSGVARHPTCRKNRLLRLPMGEIRGDDAADRKA
jgi:hypothetical protein